MAILVEQLELRMKQIMIKVTERATNSIGYAAFDHGARVRDLPCLREAGGSCFPGSTVSQPTATEDMDEIFDQLEGDGHSSSREGEEELDVGGGNSSGKLQAAPSAPALRMNFACCYIPDHNEDAHFVHRNAGFVGVADGVGGFRDTGVDASAFARALMNHALAVVDAEQSKAIAIDPYIVLKKAHLKAANLRTPGASTAVIVSLRGATLRWAYVGDSAFAVFRGGKMLHRSKPQQHYFNCPFQLRATGGDCVNDAIVGEMAVAEGDVVVVGTDGLFDNVFDWDLARMVRKGTELSILPQMMAEKIATTARKMSKSWAPSPFSVESSKNIKDGRERHYGGKVDDITVVVAFIVPRCS